MKTDGKIVIGTGLNTKELEKELDNLEKDLKNKRDKFLEAQMTLKTANRDSDDFKEALEIQRDWVKNADSYKEAIANVRQQLEEAKLSQQEMTSNIASNEITQAVQETTEATSELKDNIDDVSNSSQDIDDDFIDLEGMAKEVCDTLYQMTGISLDWREVLQEAFEEPQENAIKLNDTIKKISSNVNNIGKTIFKTSLMMMGLRSATAMFRESFARVIKDHPQMQDAIYRIKGAIDVVTDRIVKYIEPLLPKIIPLIDKVLNIILQISGRLMERLLPVIEWIINAVSWLIDALIDVYNMIVRIINTANESPLFSGIGSLLGLNMTLQEIDKSTEDFSNSADKFAKKIKEANENTKKLRKSLLGFDEMNILNEDTGSTGALGSVTSSLNDVKKETKPLAKSIVKLTNKMIKDANNVIDVVINGSEDFKNLIKLIDEGKLTINDFTTEYKDGMYIIKTKTGETFTLTEKEYEVFKNYSNTQLDRILVKWKQTFGKDSEIPQWVKNTIDSLKGSMSDGVVASAKAGIDVCNSFIEGISPMTNKTTDVVNNTKKVLNTLPGNVAQTGIDVVNSFTKGLGGLPSETDRIVNKTEDSLKGLPKWMDSNVLTKINNLLKPFGITLGNDIGANLKTSLNKVIAQIETNMKSYMTSMVGSFPYMKSLISKFKLPRLAKGGIINQPGKGVYVGGAIAGERGREGILPLDDTQQMAILGREIAKNIVINLNNRIDVDGKELARYTSKVMNDINFASNGGVI